MRNDGALALWAAACMIASPATAHAEPQAASTAPGMTVVPTAAAMKAANELMQLQEQTMLLKAQLKKLDAEAQVAEREQALHRMGDTESNAGADVSLLGTQSLGKTTTATVETSDGAELDVRAGETLPNGMRVMSIRSAAMVVIAPDGRRMTISISSPLQQRSRSFAANGAGNGGGVPPIPTLPISSR